MTSSASYGYVGSDGCHIYYWGNNLQRVPTAGGASYVVGVGGNSLVVDDAYVYTTQGNQIYRSPK